MSPPFRVQDIIGPQRVTFDDSESGFSVSNTSEPSVQNTTAASQNQEAADANFERARLNSQRAETSTQTHNRDVRRRNAEASSRSRGPGSHGSYAVSHGSYAATNGQGSGYASTSRAAKSASKTFTTNQVVINQVGKQTIGPASTYASSNAAPPTDHKSAARVGTVS